MSYNLDRPEERARCVREQGAQKYRRMMADHREANTVAVVNGYPLVRVQTRFGALIMVEGTDRAYPNQSLAEEAARGLPPR